MEIVVEEKFKRHVCSILYADLKIGTGNLITHDGHLFIVTCRHIAIEAFNSKKLKIYFTNKAFIDRNQVSLFRKNKADDLALLKIEADFPLGDLIPITLKDLNYLADLRALDRDDLAFLVVGFPSEITKPDFKHRRLGLRREDYYTMSAINRRNTKTKMYLEYPSGKDIVPNLPRAYGLSGAGIWQIPPVVSDSNSIWSPTQFKMVAIQRAWSAGEYIIGSRLKKVFDWLK